MELFGISCACFLKDCKHLLTRFFSVISSPDNLLQQADILEFKLRKRPKAAAYCFLNELTKRF